MSDNKNQRKRYFHINISQSKESLPDGLQNALHAPLELGGLNRLSRDAVRILQNEVAVQSVNLLQLLLSVQNSVARLQEELQPGESGEAGPGNMLG